VREKGGGDDKARISSLLFLVPLADELCVRPISGGEGCVASRVIELDIDFRFQFNAVAISQARSSNSNSVLSDFS